MRSLNFLIWFIIIFLFSIQYFILSDSIEQKVSACAFHCVIALLNIWRIAIDIKQNE
jgi:hypothetical protein